MHRKLQCGAYSRYEGISIVGLCSSVCPACHVLQSRRALSVSAFSSTPLPLCLSNCDALGRDAFVYEGQTFDGCGGHPTPTGTYHYHVLPGISNQGSVNASANLDYTLCQ